MGQKLQFPLLSNNETTYYIYHIPGKKIGVTSDLGNRLTIQQGYTVGEYEILEKSTDISYVSTRELELQLLYGYKIDRQSYENLIKTKTMKLNNMEINTTEQTTTFPCPVNKLKGQLLDCMNDTIDYRYGKVQITTSIIEWIMANVKPSMYNPNRSFIYNKALHESIISSKTTSANPKKQKSKDIFNKIREWATERHIYDSGDTKTQYIKLLEESGELARAILKDDEVEFIDAIGDMVVVLTNLAALKGIKIEDCIESAYNVIHSRKGKMVNGTFVKETSSPSLQIPAINYHIKSTL